MIKANFFTIKKNPPNAAAEHPNNAKHRKGMSVGAKASKVINVAQPKKAIELYTRNLLVSLMNLILSLVKPEKSFKQN